MKNRIYTKNKTLERAIKMKKSRVSFVYPLLFLLILLLTINHVSGQGIYNNGGIMHINSGATLYIGGSNADYTNVTNSTDGRIDNSGDIYLQGDWTNNAGNNVFINRDADGTVRFIGTVKQLIGGTQTTVFEDLHIENSYTGNAVVLDLNTEVSSTLNLVDGVVQTQSNRLFHSSDLATDLNNYSDTSFINGNYRRAVDRNFNTYALPLGYDSISTYYHPADFVNDNLNGVSYLDCQVNPITESGNNVDSRIATAQGALTLNNVLENAIWDITPDASPSSGRYGINLYVVNLSGLVDDEFFVVKRNSGSTDYADWDSFEGTTTVPAAGTPGRITNGGLGYAQRTEYAAFSEFAIANSTSATALNPFANKFKHNDEEYSFFIYPNPIDQTREEIYISISSNWPEGNYEISVHDVVGKVVYTQSEIIEKNRDNHIWRIPVNNIAKGTYTINIRSTKINAINRLIRK